MFCLLAPATGHWPGFGQPTFSFRNGVEAIARVKGQDDPVPESYVSDNSKVAQRFSPLCFAGAPRRQASENAPFSVQATSLARVSSHASTLRRVHVITSAMDFLSLPMLRRTLFATAKLAYPERRKPKG
jgi:hypothetical protein